MQKTEKKVFKMFEEYSKENPEEILSAPHTTPVKKIDEVQAARHPDLKYTD